MAGAITSFSSSQWSSSAILTSWGLTACKNWYAGAPCFLYSRTVTCQLHPCVQGVASLIVRRPNHCKQLPVGSSYGSYSMHGQRASGSCKLWIDCDAGVDDVQGILLALAGPCEVLAVSCVHGNADVQQVATNVCRVLTLCGRTDIPVYVGCSEPLLEPQRQPNYWYGRDGLGDMPHVPPAVLSILKQPSAGHAAVKLVECAQEHEEQLTVVALGPLTNIALACKLDPSFPRHLARLIVMGGSEHIGTVTPVCEFNFQQDVEAAAIVMKEVSACLARGQSCSVGMVSWECAERHPVPWAHVDAWFCKDTAKARFLAAIAEHAIRGAKQTPGGAKGWECADPLAVAVAICPSLVTNMRMVSCSVETQGSLTRGMAVFDWNGILKAPQNVSVVNHINMQAYLQMMDASL